MARRLAERPHLLFVCPRYEGVDERVRAMVDVELSVGDYVVSGGELPAMVVIDAVLRLLPGAIDEASPVEESFSHGLLEYPQYTRPAEFRGERVPDVLVSGDHGAVDMARRAGAGANAAQQAGSAGGVSARTRNVQWEHHPTKRSLTVAVSCRKCARAATPRK